MAISITTFSQHINRINVRKDTMSYKVESLMVREVNHNPIVRNLEALMGQLA